MINIKHHGSQGCYGVQQSGNYKSTSPDGTGHMTSVKLHSNNKTGIYPVTISKPGQPSVTFIPPSVDPQELTKAYIRKHKGDKQNENTC